VEAMQELCARGQWLTSFSLRPGCVHDRQASILILSIHLRALFFIIYMATIIDLNSTSNILTKNSSNARVTNNNFKPKNNTN